MRKFFFFPALVVIVLLSFFLYSPLYNPILNSDGAISILMTYYFKLPGDFYFWGQDRGGSLTALIAQFFLHGCNLSPVTSLSLTNYLLLVAGYIGFSGLLKSRFGKIIFAVCWFLPPLKFIDLDSSPVVMQYSLIAFSIFLFRKLDVEGGRHTAFRNYTLLISVILLLILSVWVSDTAVVTIAVFFTMVFIFDRKKIKIWRALILFLIAGLAAGVFFISYAKSHVINRTEDYLLFNNFKSIGDSLILIKDSIVSSVSFKSGELFMSLYSCFVMLLIVLVLILFFKKKIQNSGNERKWLLMFLVDGMLVFSMAVLSRWVYLNGTSGRYFFGCYISFLLFFLMVIEHLVVSKKFFLVLEIFIVVMVITGAISSPYYLKYAWPKSLKPQIAIFGELKRLGNIGIIAEYWHSYIAAAADPATIKATPHDQEHVRNPAMTEEVFAQPNLYVMRYDWMDVFPDTLTQFGHVLIKQGDEFRIAGCDVNKYKKIK